MEVSKRLEIHLMNVVTAYLYGSLDFDIHMKILEGYKTPEAYIPHNLFSIKLQRSLYGYKLLNEYLIKEGYQNDPICLYVFIKKSKTGFAIITVYVDDMNFIKTPKLLNTSRMTL